MKLAALVVCAGIGFAQDPRPSVVNAKFEGRAFSGDLAAQLRAGPATWFGYAVKSRGDRNEDCCSGCRLEESGKRTASDSPSAPIPLEGAGTIALLFRVENDSIQKIEVHSLACPLDAGGLAFVWLTGVPAGASASFLKSLVASDHLADATIFAISQHDDPAGVAALEDLARPPQPAHVRGKAIFWLAREAGNRAASFIQNAIENDPDMEVKDKAVFALSQLPREEGIPRLIEVARENRNPEVRKRAFFWLGQSNDPRALAFIEQVLTK